MDQAELDEGLAHWWALEESLIHNQTPLLLAAKFDPSATDQSKTGKATTIF